MDFWDVAKLIWRHWYVSAPMLLITAAAATWVGYNVGPDYQATGHVAVLPPVVHREGTGQLVRVNPWSEESLADAAAIRLQGKPLKDEFLAAGAKAEWTVEVTGRLPVIRLEVVTDTPEHAREAIRKLLDVVDEEVRDRQLENNIPPDERVTTVRYAAGETIEPVQSKLKRTLVVVVALGLILTTAMAVVVDAVVRRRRQAGQSQPGRALLGRKDSRPIVGQPSQPVQVRYADENGVLKPAAPTAPTSHDDKDKPRVAAVDETVILPLSNTNWS